MKKPITQIIIVSAVLMALIVFLIWYGMARYDRTLDPQDVYGTECPPCDCKITAQRIISDAIDYSELEVTKIKLPAKDKMKILIGKNTFTYDIKIKELKKEKE